MTESFEPLPPDREDPRRDDEPPPVSWPQFLGEVLVSILFSLLIAFPPMGAFLIQLDFSLFQAEADGEWYPEANWMPVPHSAPSSTWEPPDPPEEEEEEEEPPPDPPKKTVTEKAEKVEEPTKAVVETGPPTETGPKEIADVGEEAEGDTDDGEDVEEEDEPKTKKKRKKRRGPPKPCTEDNPSVTTVAEDRWEIEREVIEYYAGHIFELQRLASIWLHKNKETGEPDGFRIGIKRCSLLHEAGFRSGDVVNSVNDRTITSIMQAVGAYFSFRRETEFVVKITRKGTPMTLYYTILEPTREEKRERREEKREERKEEREERKEDRKNGEDSEGGEPDVRDLRKNKDDSEGSG